MSHYQSFIKFVCLLLGLCSIISFWGCDPNSHNTSTHPCNFPDDETGANLRSPWSFKITDKETLLNMVDTTADAQVHLDSVQLFDENLEEIEQEVEYWIDNWTYKNFEAYKDVPFNDPQALLDLDYRVFYLKTPINDYDTIEVFYEQCLITKVLFNGQSTLKPFGEPYSGGTSLYFLK